VTTSNESPSNSNVRDGGYSPLAQRDSFHSESPSSGDDIGLGSSLSIPIPESKMGEG
jgi:hypothetical protein